MRDSDGSDLSPAAASQAPFDLATELGRDLAAVDWAASPVGPWEQWPASLTNTVRLMTGSRFAMWMAWGESLTFFCNDDYRRDTLGAKYPWALGRPAREVWSEIWADIWPRIESVITTGVATWDEGLQLFLERSGYVEETYHTFSYSPVTDDDGRIAGMLCVVSEDTARVIGERRIALLRDLGGALSAAATQVDVAAATARQLSGDPFDLPFALAYLLDADGAARLHWVAGVDGGRPAAPPVLRPGDVHPWSAALFAAEPQTQVLALDTLTDVPTGGWPEPALQALAVPLRQVGEREPYGYLIAGLNRYRLLDEDYRGFVELVAGQLASAIARARAFEDERTRNEQLAELDRAKTTFFTNVSHELRTPLTLLLGPAEDALADRTQSLPDEHRRRFEVIQRNGERLLKLVNTLLDFSRLESGRVTARFEPIDLSRFTAELASMFESAFARSGLELTIACDRLPTRPYVDREMWSKIVLNLLSNALKATFTGGVTVRLQDSDGRAELAVTDTGVGIATGELERLFERFHRVSGAELRSHEGSGIGLALVAELARLHGGTVDVESRPGAGSTFRVLVPYGHDHLPEDQVADDVVDDELDVVRYSAGYLAESTRWQSEAMPDAGLAGRAAGDTTPRILVVDDNADMREYVRSLLADQYRVVTAANGAEALERMAGEAPDLVLTDVMMPVLDGFGLLAAIRDDPATLHIPVVMLSARSGDDSTIEGLEAGADDYLVKPFSARELLARVRSNLELDRVRRLVAELERSQRLLDDAERLATIGSFEVDLGRDTIRMSPEALRITGFPPDRPTTVPFEPIRSGADERDRELVRAAAQRSARDDVPIDVELRPARPDGTRYLARMRAEIVRDEHGVPRFLRGSLQDITEQRAAEQQLAAAQADREAAAREHAIATELQRSLLPQREFVADQLEIASYYRAGVAGTQVGGDWFDVIELGMGRTAVVIGDVMGRGVHAAAVMGQLRAAVRAYARLALAPAELIRLLDDTVREISDNTIVTCIYAVYDSSEHALVYANAGHLPPLVTGDGPPRRLTAGGPPLGAGRHGNVSETVALPPGALLTLYTDGLVERRGSDLDEGIDRLAEVITTSSVPTAALPSALADALLADGPDDDVAVLVCRPTARPDGERRARHAVGAGDDALADARRFVAAATADWGVDDGTRFTVRLAVSELVTNAIKHGARPIEVQLVLRDRCLRLEVRDCGDGAPTLRRSGPGEGSGRGLLIVATLAHAWGTERTRKGKTVWCEFEPSG